MRMQSIVVRLGARDWPVRPLTVAQVQAIEPLVLGIGSATGSIATAIGILRIALSRDHADAAAALEDVEASAPEIATAMTLVLRLGGFIAKGDIGPGEAEAGSPPASTGRVSMLA